MRRVGRETSRVLSGLALLVALAPCISAEVEKGSRKSNRPLIGNNPNTSARSLLRAEIASRGGHYSLDHSNPYHYGVLIEGLHGDQYGTSFIQLEETIAAQKYTIRADNGKYCTDKGVLKVQCGAPTIGPGEQFEIFHFTLAPSLHVFKGPFGRKYCGEVDGKGFVCDKSFITKSEIFFVSTLGGYLGFAASESDRWCSLKSDGGIRCDASDVNNPGVKYEIMMLP